MFHVVLFEPEIPPNTGNVIRLCANTGAHLHLVQPLGFSLADKALARAGLDYHDLARVSVHADWAACRAALLGRRLFVLTTRGSVRYDQPHFQVGDAFIFGSETRGLPEVVHAAAGEERRLRLPMQPSNRSMNLSNTVAVVVFEAWRQLGFPGGS
jgi:tRNA (cytidine/uridine-2'-O-)-methyltransferase